jgi:hypothetical protein
MVDLHVRILYVDPYGFCGREPHPLAEHKGRIGRVVKYEIECEEEGPDYMYGVYTVLLLDADGNPTNEQFEYIDFEVELVGLVERKGTDDAERKSRAEETQGEAGGDGR